MSPTLPLPPPDRPTEEGPDAAGNVRLTGIVPEPGATVFALNERTDFVAGQRTGANSTYAISLPAQLGDRITFWYAVGTEQSPYIRFSIGNRAP